MSRWVHGSSGSRLRRVLTAAIAFVVVCSLHLLQLNVDIATEYASGRAFSSTTAAYTLRTAGGKECRVARPARWWDTPQIRHTADVR